MSTTETHEIHPFERSGCGIAPFRLVGVETTEDRQERNSYLRGIGEAYTTNMCGGTCEHCGTPIWTVCIIADAHGKRFKVGSDCVLKTYRDHATDRAAAKLVADTKRRVNKIRTDKANARKDARIEAAREAMTRDDVREALAAQPHPRKWCADAGMTLLDWAEWMMKNAGRKGKCEAAAVVEKVAA